MAFDVQDWLARIGYDGPRAPTLATLGDVVLAHCTHIPYENLDVLIGEVPLLDLDSLADKMLRRRRGGYCFEQNFLLRAGLQAMGFDVRGLIGRVVRGFPPDAPRNAGHMALRVELQDGVFLVDVGFGNLSPTGALRLEPDIVQQTPHERLRFITVGDELVLQVELGGAWDNLYRLCNYVPLDADFEVANWYVATRPGSLFAENLIVARPGPGGVRYTFLNGRSTVRLPDGTVERRLLADADAIAADLAATFGLAVPADLARAAVEALKRRGTLAAEHRFFA